MTVNSRFKSYVAAIRRKFKMKILGVCGERSGDLILKRIQRTSPHQFLGAVWSPCPNQEVPVLFDGPKELGVMGFGLEVLKSIPNAYRRMSQIQNWIDRHPELNVLLTIDSKAFSLRLQQQTTMKNTKIKSVHVCAPSSVWAFSSNSSHVAAKNPVHRLCTVLPFEPAYWHSESPERQVHFVGYFAVETLLDFFSLPAASTASISLPAPAFAESTSHRPRRPHEVPFPAPTGQLPKLSPALRKETQHKLFPFLLTTTKLLLLVPGSRLGEVASSFPFMQSVAKRMMKRDPTLVVMVLGARTVLDFVSKHSQFPVYDEEEWKVQLMCAADVALAVSGTIVTELLLFGCPTASMYNSGGKITEWIARYRATVDYITVVNLLAGKRLVPEFFFNLDEEVVSKELETLLRDGQDARISQYLNQLVRWNGAEPVRPSAVVNHVMSFE